MKKKMEDIARPGGGIRKKDDLQASPEHEEQRKDPRAHEPEKASEARVEPVREKKNDKPENPWSASKGPEPDGTLHNSVRSLDARDKKRDENQFLRKLHNKRSDIKGHISRGGGFRRPKRKLWKYVLGLFVIIFLGIYVFFPSVTIEVTPRVESVVFASSSSYAAMSESGQGLSYNTVTVTKKATGAAEATGVKEIEEKASGKITVYNTYSAEPLTLIDNTRFESPDGKIYRIDEPVTVPGMEGGSPGKVTVMVHADEIGDEYNFTKVGAKFTIPGLSGSPAYYQAFYANVTTPIDGGYSGISKVVSPDELERVKNTVSNQLRDELVEQARAGLSQEYILLDGASRVSFDAEVKNRADLEEGAAKVVVTGTLKGVVFDRSDLLASIAKQELEKYNGGDISVADWSNVTFAFDTPDEGEEAKQEKAGTLADINNMGKITFGLSGSMRLLWSVPKEEIVRALAGKEKSDFKQIMSHFQYRVASAQTSSMQPFWKSTFPDDSEDITVEVAERS